MPHAPNPPHGRQRSTLTHIVERNIRALLARRQGAETRRPLHERIADRITRFAGSMPFVYLHLCLFGLWIIASRGWFGLPRFDPSLVLLAMFASVEAIFLSTFILITQNRMAALADKRADLDLQISLLAEHEITRLIVLVREIAKRMGIEEAGDDELSELSRDVHPEEVLDTLEVQEHTLKDDEHR